MQTIEGIIQLYGKYTSNMIFKMDKEPKQTIFFNTDIQMANRYVKRFSKSLVISQMQISTTMSHSLAGVRRYCKRWDSNAGEGVEKGSPWTPRWQCELASTMENSRVFSHKIINRTPIFSSNSTSGYIYPKEMKTGPQKDICTSCLSQCCSPWPRYGDNLGVCQLWID